MSRLTINEVGLLTAVVIAVSFFGGTDPISFAVVEALVLLALRDRLQVLQIPSVVRVGFNGTPTALPDDEMQALRDGLSRQLRAEPHPYLTVGPRVGIIGGPFKRLEGVLLRKKNNFRVVLWLELILRSIVVDVDVADVVPLSGRKGN